MTRPAARRTSYLVQDDRSFFVLQPLRHVAASDASHTGYEIVTRTRPLVEVVREGLGRIRGEEEEVQQSHGTRGALDDPGVQ